MSLSRKSLPLEDDERDKECEPALYKMYRPLKEKKVDLDTLVNTMKAKSKELKELTQSYLQTAQAAKFSNGEHMYKSKKGLAWSNTTKSGGRKRKTRKHKKARKSHRR